MDRPLAGIRDATFLYYFLLEPLASSHALADVVLRRQGRKLSGSVAEAADSTRELATLFAPEVDREAVRGIYEQIELPLADVLADVETAGVPIYPPILVGRSAELQREFPEGT